MKFAPASWCWENPQLADNIDMEKFLVSPVPFLHLGCVIRFARIPVFQWNTASRIKRRAAAQKQKGNGRNCQTESLVTFSFGDKTVYVKRASARLLHIVINFRTQLSPWHLLLSNNKPRKPHRWIKVRRTMLKDKANTSQIGLQELSGGQCCVKCTTSKIPFTWM